MSLAAVLLLVPPDVNQKPQPLRMVLGALGIDLSKDNKIKAFVDAIEKVKALTVTIAAPPSLVTDAAPTSGLWCLSLINAYEIVQRVKFTISSDVIDSLADWIDQELSITLKKDDLSRLELSVVVTKTTRYPVDAGGAPTSTSVASFAFDMGRFRLNVDLSSTDVTLLVTPNPSAIGNMSVLSLVNQAFSAAAGRPSSSLPDTTDGSDPVVAFFGNLIYPWYLQLSLDKVGKTTRLNWGVGMLIIKSSLKSDPIIIGLSYDSKTSTFSLTY